MLKDGRSISSADGHLRSRSVRYHFGLVLCNQVKAKLDQQRNLYDAVCTDRNLYSKNLIESNEEIAEMRRKFKIIYHQIEQLKEEIKEKDQTLIKEHFEHHKVARILLLLLLL